MLVTLFSVALAAPDAYAPVIDQAFVQKINNYWRGVGIGYDSGLWGEEFAQGLKVDVPFGPTVGQFVGIRLRGLVVHLDTPLTPYEPMYLWGGELFGRGPVWGGVVRVYGGGGVWYGTIDYGIAEDSGVAWGGHYGIEAILFDRGSFQFEIGGQSGIDGDGPGGGVSIMGGIMFYFGGFGT